MTHVYFFWEDNETLHRTIPKDVFLVTEAVPREDTIAIGKEQTIDSNHRQWQSNRQGLPNEGRESKSHQKIHLSELPYFLKIKDL